MDVTTDTLRKRYSDKSAAELQRIAGSAEGEYTPEAVTVAREILAGRPAGDGPAPSEADEAVGSSRWSGIIIAVFAVFAIRKLFYAWLAFERDPRELQVSLHQALRDPGPYVLVALLLGWLWLRRWLRAAAARREGARSRAIGGNTE